MEQTLTEKALADKNAMILRGQIVEATSKYFADDATTTDFDGTQTQGKQEMEAKMQGFAGSIAEVKTIELKRSVVQGDVSFAEFVFNFIMKDDSEIYWHEIIRSLWRDGKVVEEQYFKA